MSTDRISAADPDPGPGQVPGPVSIAAAGGSFVAGQTGALRDAGGEVAWLDLPAEGITGNSHMIMFDDNAGDILSTIITWLRAHNWLWHRGRA